MKRAKWQPRRAPVVAFLGPDGAGKGTLISALRRQLPVPVTAMYLGFAGASSVAYTPARAGDRARARVAAGAGLAAVRGALRAVAVQTLPPGVVDEQYRVRHVLRATYKSFSPYLPACRGEVVLCDRHPVERFALAELRGESLTSFEKAIVRYVMRQPDVIVVLDAPGDVLFARKREHSAAVLEAWRRQYIAAFAPRGARVVSTEGALERSVAETADVVLDAVRSRRIHQ